MVSNVPGQRPDHCINSKTIADMGKGKDRDSLVFLVQCLVVKYMVIRYDAVHNPAGKLYTTKSGKWNCSIYLLALSTFCMMPILLKALNRRIFLGRYSKYIAPPIITGINAKVHIREEHLPNFSNGLHIILYLLPFERLCVLQSIWQLLSSVAPPLLHAVIWSASISFSDQILSLLGPSPQAQSGQLLLCFFLASSV